MENQRSSWIKNQRSWFVTLQFPPQDHQLMSKRRVLGFKPQPRPERRGQDAQQETEKPDHPASLSDSVTSSTGQDFRYTHQRFASFSQGSELGVRSAQAQAAIAIEYEGA
jgi:hypothetical protein